MGQSPQSKNDASLTPDQEMDFPDALREVMAGGKVTRGEWNDEDTFLAIRGGFLCIHKSDGGGVFNRLLVSDGDMFASDWYVVGGSTQEVLH